MTPVLTIEDLHVWFELPNHKELHAVQGISFALEPGERIGRDVSRLYNADVQSPTSSV